MARLRQGIKTKYAKNNKAKYSATNSKHTITKTTSQGTTKKFAYTKKITINGKTRYYYA